MRINKEIGKKIIAGAVILFIVIVVTKVAGFMLRLQMAREFGKQQQTAQAVSTVPVVVPEIKTETKVEQKPVVTAKETFSKEHINNMKKMCLAIDDKVKQIQVANDKLAAKEFKTVEELLKEYDRIKTESRTMAAEFKKIAETDTERRDGGIELAQTLASQLDSAIVGMQAGINTGNMDKFESEYKNTLDIGKNVKDMMTALNSVK